jgi:hypothetical protein
MRRARARDRTLAFNLLLLTAAEDPRAERVRRGHAHARDVVDACGTWVDASNTAHCSARTAAMAMFRRSSAPSA